MKPNQRNFLQFATFKATPSAIALGLSLALANVPARADELADLKAQIQTLSKRLSDLEANQAAARAAPVVATQPSAVPQSVPVALTTDQNGVPTGSQSAVTLYNNANTTLQIYGLLEATISRVDHQTPGGGYATGFQTAWFSGNRLGFDADHALDFGTQFGMPDLKVISKLETEFELPTGNSDTKDVLFNRDAWLGLYSDELGKVTFGRQNTLTRDFTQNWGDAYGTPDVVLKEGGYSNVNNFKQFIFYSASADGTRLNSSIVWKKKWDENWVTGLAYGFGSAGSGGSGDVGTGGSIPGDFTNGTTQEASVAYNHLVLGPGAINANLSYDRSNNHGLIHQSELLGGNYVIGPFRLNGGYVHYTAQQGLDNSAGERTDNSFTTSIGYLVGKTEFDLGYQEIKGDHAGFNAHGVTLNPFGNTSGVTTFANGAKDTIYGSVFYHADRQTDFYFATDYFRVKGGWEVGDAQGNGQTFGDGQPSKSELELAVGVRYKF